MPVSVDERITSMRTHCEGCETPGAMEVRSRKSRFCHPIVSSYRHGPKCVPFKFLPAAQATGWLAISDSQSSLRQVRRVVRGFRRSETSASYIGPASAHCSHEKVAYCWCIIRPQVNQ